MRIISGVRKSHIIKPPKNLKVRPTTDYSKESLFNILNVNFNISDLEVLDLFSGTGNISFEFASRGCKKIICVDNTFNCFNYIKQEIRNLEFIQMKAVRANALNFLKKTDDKFDIIFADPPYKFKDYNQLIEEIFQRKILKWNGWFILEHSSENSFMEHINFKEKRKYGQSTFSFFTYFTSS